MQDDQPVSVAAPPRPSRLVRLAQRLESTKVNILTVVLFIGALAVLSFAAACIGYLAHHLRR